MLEQDCCHQMTGKFLLVERLQATVDAHPFSSETVTHPEARYLKDERVSYLCGLSD